MTKRPSIVGGSCIIASVCVGAGMLALPSSGAGAWTSWSTLIIVFTMLMMTFSGWLLLESYKTYDLRVSFSTVTKDLLGTKVNIINNLAVYFVGGILLYAYTTASGSILNGLLGSYIDFGEMSSRIWSAIFVLIFSIFVWCSTLAVDRISVLLVITMLLTFVFSVFGLVTHIDILTLLDSQNTGGQYAKYAIGLFPVALTSFGYHHSVSSMRAYYGEEKKAQKAILYGTSIALLLYLTWIFSIFGNLPRDQFGPIMASEGDVNVLLSSLGSVIHSEKVHVTIRAFSIAAILSSFIGVGLGVFDFLADFFKFSNTQKGRTASWAATFLPPLILSVLFPTGFLIAIGYAGAVATIWTCIIPALLAKKARQRPDHNVGFKVFGGNVLIYMLIVYGVCTALFHFMNMFNILDKFTI